jgi:ABC-type bacteriocin/lantibiotic exporter with double-glycine peptidase domain
MKFILLMLCAFTALSSPVSVFASTSALPSSMVPVVPFYSQFADISSAKWQKVGCGITSLAMLISYYKQTPVSVDTLLTEGVKAGAYSNAGWTYSGLLQVAKQHGLTGTANDLSASGSAAAYASFTRALVNGPVIASVHYKFEPKNPIPHLVVVNAVKNGLVYYNDPAAKTGQKTISVETFRASWKMRYITIRPGPSTLALAGS